VGVNEALVGGEKVAAALTSKSHTGFERDPGYEAAQIDRHRLKSQAMRTQEEYRRVCDAILETGFQTSGAQMICLGTRNNHERDCFAKLLPGASVKSLDIAPGSHADYIMDFTRLPDDWSGKWDIVYSNSLDHSFDANETFMSWLRIIRSGGVLAVGVDYGAETTASDICSFHRDQVAEFIGALSGARLIGTAVTEYETWIIQKD